MNNPFLNNNQTNDKDKINLKQNKYGKINDLKDYRNQPHTNNPQASFRSRTSVEDMKFNIDAITFKDLNSDFINFERVSKAIIL